MVTRSKNLATTQVVIFVNNNGDKDQPMINTFPIHLEYTNNMLKVDVMDHVRSNYSC
jgi:hypothetical protein